ncbi:Na+/H+ antiporter subunit A [Corynebacterium choanae]|uniref:Na(+)/H(+) antiporter subunit A n=1 Tax=Corynebacterium choanae TaxID=1862358 RepID=A0A3G6J3T5_9CORY|nr:Na+/H+ antiporter subunit A [Corynebacterium choanae]AZA12725.1 Na(+)/H(+) antiporter subunit A [Corynebacterium choanae]
MLTILGVVTVTAVVMPLLVRTCGRYGFIVAALALFACAGWLLQAIGAGLFTGDQPPTATYDWMPQAHLSLDFRMDGLASVFALIVLTVGGLVLCYTAGYFDQVARRLTLFGAQMVAFAAAMFGLVIADSLLVMYIFWEITSILSFLLVGYYGERASSRRAAGQALMVTVAGGLAMLVGIVLLGVGHGIWRFSEFETLPADAFDQVTLQVAVVCLLAGAVTKSALAPMHFWLPQAMAAPTPVSAYLHSAAMVKAGVYLIARLAPTASQWPMWHVIVIPLGLFTMLLGGWMALKAFDLKLVLAYGTISQLGFMVAVFAIGSPQAMQAGLLTVVAHACFKSALFMVVGAIDHATGTRDLRRLQGLGRLLPIPAVIAAVACFSMAGVPPTVGFIAKEAVLATVVEEPIFAGMPAIAMTVAVVAGSVLTFAYSAYFFLGAFGSRSLVAYPGRRRQEPSAADTVPAAAGLIDPATVHRPGVLLLASPAIVAGLSLLFGILPQLVEQLIQPPVRQRFTGAHGNDSTAGEAFNLGHIALFHGWTVPLALTLVVFTTGAIVVSQLRVIRTLMFTRPALGSADHAYEWIVQQLRLVSQRITASTQKGSLPVNEAVILATFVALPGIVLLLGERAPVTLRLWDHPVQAVVCAVMMIAAVAATAAQHRLSALLVVGVTGFGTVVVFALHGAPDLALTQAVVETLTVVVMVLLLRKLPHRPPAVDPDYDPRLRGWLAAASGLMVTVLGVYAANAREHTPVGAVIGDLAKRIGHGANAVNVLLVDIRAFDTLGEISVLAVVAVGVSSLVYRTRPFTRRSKRPTLPTHGATLLTSDVVVDPAAGQPSPPGTGQTLAASSVASPGQQTRPHRPQLMVDVAARLLFHPMLIVAAYFFFSGHNGPGGGFAAGLVVGLALTLRYLAGGAAELEATLPVNPSSLLGAGLVIATGTTIVPLLFGVAPLTSSVVDLHLPLIGELHVVSAMVLDIGVFLIVVGLVLHILSSLGIRLDAESQRRSRRTSTTTNTTAPPSTAAGIHTSPAPPATGNPPQPTASPTTGGHR